MEPKVYEGELKIKDMDSKRARKVEKCKMAINESGATIEKKSVY